MSNGIRYDSLLVHYLAAELDERLRGRPLNALGLDPARRLAVLDLGGEGVLWDLHPAVGTVRIAPAPVLPEPVPLARKTRIRRVIAPSDERLLVFELDAAQRRADRPARLVVELMGNQWNLLALAPDDRLLAVLWRRSAGGRELRPGQRYQPPPLSGRSGAMVPLALETWRELLGALRPENRARRLISDVAYTSPLNAAAILGEAAEVEDASALEVAHARYAALATLPPPVPHLLWPATLRQPYPLPLPGVEGVHFPTLLAAIEAAATVEGAALPPPALPIELVDRLRARIGEVEKRRERLEAELTDAAAGAERLRAQADLLISQLYLVRKGVERVTVPDFEGGMVEIALDPALSPAENATALYEQARKRARAAERIPPLLERTEGDVARLRALLERAERGEVGAEEIERVLPAVAERPAAGAEAPLLPYRRYRTSGGLEVRVGRSSRANDELTLRHSAPNDIWLHARDVAGAHVLLRWRDAQANPPARDLAEAAALAALHSRSRTSGLVAVDWTRRKYVRKPRKAPPGLVVTERAKTLFVEPDPAIERALRAEARGDHPTS